MRETYLILLYEVSCYIFVDLKFLDILSSSIDDKGLNLGSSLCKGTLLLEAEGDPTSLLLKPLSDLLDVHLPLIMSAFRVDKQTEIRGPDRLKPRFNDVGALIYIESGKKKAIIESLLPQNIHHFKEVLGQSLATQRSLLLLLLTFCHESK